MVYPSGLLFLNILITLKYKNKHEDLLFSLQKKQKIKMLKLLKQKMAGYK